MLPWGDGKGLRSALERSKIAVGTCHNWQTMCDQWACAHPLIPAARVPEEKIRSLEAELTETEQELTSAYVHRVAERPRREGRHDRG